MDLSEILDFEKIFENEDYESYLDRVNEIPKKMLIDTCTHLLSFRNENLMVNNHEKLLEKWFCSENNDFANEVNNKIDNYINDGEKNIVIINTRTSLTLFEKVLLCETTSTEISNVEFEKLIFKIYLAYNQKLNNNDNLVIETAKAISDYPEIYKLAIANSLPTFDITNYNLYNVFICQVIKSIFLLEFLNQREDTQRLLNDFYQKFKVSDYKSFLNKLLPISFKIIKANKEGYIDLEVEKDDNYEDNIDFLDKLTVNSAILDEIDMDFLILRANPLYKINESTYRIIFPLFAIEKNFNGLYFLLKEVNDSYPKKERVKLRQIVTYDFSEKHVLYSLLNRTYFKKYIKLSGEQMKTPGAIDYYIRNGNKVFLFESKDILIKADIKDSYDFREYLNALQAKLYYEQSGEKISAKAVLQLAKFAKKILKGEFKEDSKYKMKSVRIYPIIILHNRQLDIAGLNNLINIWFNKEIDLMNKESINTDNLKLPTIIHIDTLILFHEQLSSGNLKLDDILDNYQNWINENRLKRKKFKNETDLHVAVQEQLISFNMYMNINYSWKLPSLFKEKGLTLFDNKTPSA
jgi:hypothetical protein